MHPSSHKVLSCDLTLLPDGRLSPCTLTIDSSGLITQVQPGASPHTDGVEHLTGQLLTPSFINAHTHLAMACFRGIEVNQATQHNMVENLFYHIESHLTAEDVAAFAKMGAYESLLQGVGLVWEHYYHGEALAAAIADTGLCAVVAPTLQDLSGPGVPSLDDQLDTTQRLHDPAWRARGIWSALGPHATDTVSDDLWRTALELASRHDLPIHAHVAQSIEAYERSISRHGVSPITRLARHGVLDGAPHMLLVHALFTHKADLALLDPARHTLGYCPFSQLIFGFPAHLHRWHEHGIPYIVATDAAASNDSMNLQKELRHLAGLRTQATSSSRCYEDFYHSGSLEDAAHTWATRQLTHAALTPVAEPEHLLATILHRPGTMHPHLLAGQIAPGAIANLTAWDLAHPHLWPPSRPQRALVMNDCTQAISNMMSLGKWLGTHHNYHRSILATPDYEDALDEASRRLDALLRRTGLR